MGRVVRQLMHGWSLMKDDRANQGPVYPMGSVSTGSYRSSRGGSGLSYYNDRSILGSIYTRMAVDVSQITFYHARMDSNGIAVSVMDSTLNDRLTLDANIDQTSQAFFADAAMTMFQRGHVAIIPTEADFNPFLTNGYAIGSMRCGRVVNWYPRDVTIEVWDDSEEGGGVHKQVTMPKSKVCIVENPFYDVMNSPSGPLQRLIKKLGLLDAYDEAAASGRLDILLQLPHAVRGDRRQKEASDRLEAIVNQLKDSELGLAYIDVTEKVIQLNRPIENKLLEQIETLYKQVFTELGLTPEVINGTADVSVMNYYYDRIVEAVATAIALEIKRKFLSKTARTQNQSIEIYRDPLKIIPIEQLGDVADKLIRNELVTANEFRPKIGFRPSADPKANELRNPNMPQQDQPPMQGEGGTTINVTPIRPDAEREAS